MNMLFLLGRILFGGFFLLAGMNHFLQLDSMAEFSAMKGVPMPSVAVVLSGLLLVLGGLSILAGAWPRVGIVLIVIFLIPTSFIMHDFWTVQEPMQRAAEQTNFMKNLAMAGAALMLLSVPRPWPYSWPRRTGRKD